MCYPVCIGTYWNYYKWYDKFNVMVAWNTPIPKWL